MEKRMGNGSFVVMTLVLVLVLAYCSTGVVMSRTSLSALELEGYYYEKEQELVKDAREFLGEKGFANSGVMLTRVVDENGSRQYTLTIHHGRISKMSEEDRQVLMKELEGLVFEDKDSVFQYKFFVNQ